MRLRQVVAKDERCFQCGDDGDYGIIGSRGEPGWTGYLEDENGRIFCGMSCYEFQLRQDAKAKAS